MVPDDVSVAVRTVESGAGRLAVAVLDPAGEHDRTFVVGMGHEAWLEEFELQRFRLLAGVLRARLIVVETPGHGPSGSHLTASERWGLLTRADLRPVAQRMLAAAAAADPAAFAMPPTHEQPLALGMLGYSLGASVATAMARLLRERTGSPVEALVLVEPVAGRRWRPLDLAGASREEDTLVDVALAQNDGVTGAVAPWDRRRPDPPAPGHHRLDLLLYANALRAGGLGAQVVAGGAPRVVVVRGKDSRLSLSAAVADLVGTARAAGIDVDELVMLGTHSLWQSLPSVRRLGRFVADALGGGR